MCFIPPNSLLACGTTSGSILVLDPVNQFCQVDRLDSQSIAITCLHAIPVHSHQSPSILVSKSARSSESKYVDLSLGRLLLFCVQFSRFADTSKHTTRPSRRCHSPRFDVERRVFVFGRTRSFDSVLEYDRWKARSIGGRHAQQSVELFLSGIPRIVGSIVAKSHTYSACRTIRNSSRSPWMAL